MKSSDKQVIINHPAKKLYKIVLDIEKYPDYIPWCSNAIIHSKTKKNLIADLSIDYKFFKKTFTSNVRFDSKKLIIDVLYINGPLKNLETKWLFKEVDKNNTKVDFIIKFEFKNFIYQNLAEIFFDLIENKMIISFIKRADDILD